MAHYPIPKVHQWKHLRKIDKMIATSNTHVEGRRAATWNNSKKTLVDVH